MEQRRTPSPRVSASSSKFRCISVAKGEEEKGESSLMNNLYWRKAATAARTRRLERMLLRQILRRIAIKCSRILRRETRSPSSLSTDPARYAVAQFREPNRIESDETRDYKCELARHLPSDLLFADT